MAFDLDLTADVLKCAKRDAESLDRPDVYIARITEAIAEFARLRKAMEKAIETTVYEDFDDWAQMECASVGAPTDWIDHSVLLVKVDE